jgi:type III secretory pathway component EscR
VDAVYACRGQLVVCSNMTVRDVSVLLGDRVGVAVVRRIKEATEVDADGTTTSSRILDFFAENPFATYRQHLSAEQDSDTPESGANQSDGNEDVGIYV